MRAICINAKGARQLCEGEYYDITPAAYFKDGVEVSHDGAMLGAFNANRFRVVDANGVERPIAGRTAPCCGGLIPPGQDCKYHGP
jgi:hypothetical protein